MFEFEKFFTADVKDLVNQVSLSANDMLPAMVSITSDDGAESYVLQCIDTAMKVFTGGEFQKAGYLTLSDGPARFDKGSMLQHVSTEYAQRLHTKVLEIVKFMQNPPEVPFFPESAQAPISKITPDEALELLQKKLLDENIEQENFIHGGLKDHDRWILHINGKYFDTHRTKLDDMYRIDIYHPEDTNIIASLVYFSKDAVIIKTYHNNEFSKDAALNLLSIVEG